MFAFGNKFHWSWFVMLQSKISQHWFRSLVIWSLYNCRIYHVAQPLRQKQAFNDILIIKLEWKQKRYFHQICTCKYQSKIIDNRPWLAQQGFRKSFSAWGLNFKQFSAGFNFQIVGHGYKDFINKNVQHRCISALKLWESNQKEMTNMKHVIYWKNS